MIMTDTIGITDTSTLEIQEGAVIELTIYQAVGIHTAKRTYSETYTNIFTSVRR